MALPKSHRLSLRFDRERLNKTGKTFFGQFFTLIVADSPVNTTRFAIILSKKTAPLAVDRNKIKRVSSSLLESLLLDIPVKDYLLIPKRQVLSAKYLSLLKDLKTLFPK